MKRSKNTSSSVTSDKRSHTHSSMGSVKEKPVAESNPDEAEHVMHEGEESEEENENEEFRKMIKEARINAEAKDTVTDPLSPSSRGSVE